MTWTIAYHHEVEEDLNSVGPSMARRIVRAINTRLTCAPMDFGKPLSGNLANFRKLRIGDCRVVYQVHKMEVLVYVLAIGPRRDRDIYATALKRR